MDHLAILSKKGNFLDKILSGEKTIESRWYKFEKTPYKKIVAGDSIYFKESGKPVSVKAIVAKALFFDDLNDDKIKNIIQQYGQQLGVSPLYADKIKGKKFCTLIFLHQVEEIKPFHIDKTGYGMMAAWITVEDINIIKL